MSITISEILSQPETWESVLNKQTKNIDEIRNDLFGKTNLFVGSGTSFYLSQSAACIFSKYTNQHSLAVPSAEVILFPELIMPKSSENYSAFLISRSGTTTEILLAGDIIEKERKIITSSITCRTSSELTKYGKHKFLLNEADEQSVIMTRSFTSMLLQIQLLADSISGSKYFNQLKKLPDIGDSLIKNNQSFVKDMINSNSFKSFVFLGQGPLFGIASESMLKITEMSLSISNVYHSLEFRHGPMSRVDENTLITFFVSKQSLAYEKSLIKEMHDLGAKILVICDNVTSDIKNNADFIIELNSGMLQFENLILYLPIAQFIGYYQAIKKGLNPDKPQNLTQVVTL